MSRLFHNNTATTTILQNFTAAEHVSLYKWQKFSFTKKQQILYFKASLVIWYSKHNDSQQHRTHFIAAAAATAAISFLVWGRRRENSNWLAPLSDETFLFRASLIKLFPVTSVRSLTRILVVGSFDCFTFYQHFLTFTANVQQTVQLAPQMSDSMATSWPHHVQTMAISLSTSLNSVLGYDLLPTVLRTLLDQLNVWYKFYSIQQPSDCKITDLSASAEWSQQPLYSFW